MRSSIASYPTRGHYGNSAYRGNSTGLIYRDLFRFLRPSSVCDPMEGSGTTGDVCRELGIAYHGFDLHTGFNALKDSLRARLPESVGLVSTHPAYHSIVRYTGEDWIARFRPDSPWGTVAHPDDLSRCETYDEFIEKLQLAFLNFMEAVRPGGHLCVLIGDIRQKGAYYSPQADIIKMGLGSLRSIIIKGQHNCVSDRNNYSGNFIPIQHEYLMVFQKEKGLTIADLAIARSRAQAKDFYGTWKNVLTVGLRELGGEAHLSELYRWCGSNIEHTLNRNIEAKVRQVLQNHFERVGEGRYRLPESAQAGVN